MGARRATAGNRKDQCGQSRLPLRQNFTTHLLLARYTCATTDYGGVVSRLVYDDIYANLNLNDVRGVSRDILLPVHFARTVFNGGLFYSSTV